MRHVFATSLKLGKINVYIFATKRLKIWIGERFYQLHGISSLTFPHCQIHLVLHQSKKCLLQKRRKEERKIELTKQLNLKIKQLVTLTYFAKTSCIVEYVEYLYVLISTKCLVHLITIRLRTTKCKRRTRTPQNVAAPFPK